MCFHFFWLLVSNDCVLTYCVYIKTEREREKKKNKQKNEKQNPKHSDDPDKPE